MALVHVGDTQQNMEDGAKYTVVSWSSGLVRRLTRHVASSTAASTAFLK